MSSEGSTDTVEALPKYKLTFTSPRSATPGFLRVNVREQESRSMIIEASNLQEAEDRAQQERLRYPVNWAVSVEEIIN